MKDSLDKIGSDAMPLMGFVDDHIPDGSTIDKVRQHTDESDQMIAVPRTQCHIRVAQHVPNIFERPFLGPGCLMKQLEKLLRLKLFFFRERDDRLEGRRHLGLQ